MRTSTRRQCRWNPGRGRELLGGCRGRDERKGVPSTLISCQSEYTTLTPGAMRLSSVLSRCGSQGSSSPAKMT